MPRPAELDLWLTYAQANAMLLKWLVVGSGHFEKLVDVHPALSSKTNSTFAVVHHVDRSGGKADARGRRRSAEIMKIFGCRPLRSMTHADGRRPKISKGGNRDGENVCGPVALQGVGAWSRSPSSAAICYCMSDSLAISRVISLASRGGNGRPSPVTSVSMCNVLYLLFTLMRECFDRTAGPSCDCVSRPFTDQADALAVRATEILLVDTGNANHRPDVALAMALRDQRPQQHADIDPIRLCSAGAPVDLHAGRVDHQTFNTACLEEPCQPEGIVSDLVAEHDRRRLAAYLGPAIAGRHELRHQPFRIPASDRIQARLRSIGKLECQKQLFLLSSTSGLVL